MRIYLLLLSPDNVIFGIIMYNLKFSITLLLESKRCIFFPIVHGYQCLYPRKLPCVELTATCNNLEYTNIKFRCPTDYLSCNDNLKANFNEKYPWRLTYFGVLKPSRRVLGNALKYRTKGKEIEGHNVYILVLICNLHYENTHMRTQYVSLFESRDHLSV